MVKDLNLLSLVFLLLYIWIATYHSSTYHFSDLDTSGLKSGLRHALFPYGDTDDDPEDDSNDIDKELLLDPQGHSGVDQIDTYLMRHDLGVDLAVSLRFWVGLDLNRIHSKYLLFYSLIEQKYGRNMQKVHISFKL